MILWVFFFFFQAEDGIRDRNVTGVQTCALPISSDGLAALDVALPVPAEIPAVEEVAGDRDPSALARRARARRVGREQRDRDGRVRLLERPRHIADLEVGVDVLLDVDLPEAPVDAIGRILGPQLQHGVETL